jgi:tellurite resistance protein
VYERGHKIRSIDEIYSSFGRSKFQTAKNLSTAPLTHAPVSGLKSAPHYLIGAQTLSDTSVIDHHTALVYVMVFVSASDREMTDPELRMIGEIVNYLPIFRAYDQDRLTQDAASCADLLSENDGLDTAIALIKDSLPDQLRETAYAVACDVAAADGSVHQEELRMLELLRHGLGVGRLPAAAIERGARARHVTL